MKVLIVQTAFPGDVILTTPLIRTVALSTNTPVSVLVRPETADILKNNPHVGEIITYNKKNTEKGLFPLLALAKKLRKKGFQQALIPHRSMRSALLVRLSGIKDRIGFDKAAGSFLYTQQVHYRNDLHETERNLEISTAAGYTASDCMPEIFPDNHDKRIVQDIINNFQGKNGKKIIALAPGSIWPTKRWPSEHYSKLASMLLRRNDTTVVLIGGESDRELCDTISKNNTGILNTAGHLSLRQSAFLLSLASALISNDSAPVHLASAVGTRTIALFGPTVPAFGFGPLAEGSLVLEKELPCRPCGIHGPRRCRKSHFSCLRTISPEEVYSVLEGFFS